MKRRTARKGRYFGSPFTGKIVCGDCGAFYGHRVWHSNEKYRKNIWLCNKKYANGHKCAPPHVTDDELEQAFIIIANRILADKAEYIDSFEERILPLAFDVSPQLERKEILKSEILKLTSEIERIIRDNAARPQDQVEYVRKYDELTRLLEKKETEVALLEQQISDLLARQGQIHVFLQALKQSEESFVTIFRAATWHAFVDYAVIMADRTIVFHIRDGSTITVPLEEAKRRK